MFQRRGPQGVSIHALLAECDTGRLCRILIRGVSIHALLAECDVFLRISLPSDRSAFQSTHSLRSATYFSSEDELTDDVSIHALLAECDSESGHVRAEKRRFNPRTPCGVRRSKLNSRPRWYGFQSTHSLRSATSVTRDMVRKITVSIHALLAECDRRTVKWRSRW